jgi:hypothetical protein
METVARFVPWSFGWKLLESTKGLCSELSAVMTALHGMVYQRSRWRWW